jgi:GNAT superfamily N-acetyltransferase
MKIHALGREEIKECLRIAGGLPEWFNERGLKRIAADILNEETAVAVDDKVLGFVTFKKVNEWVAEILWLAVRRERRGEGTGTALVKHVERWTRDSGIKMLVVKTSAAEDYEPYAETRGFYEHLGFVEVARIDPFPDWGEPGVIYAQCFDNQTR